MNRCLEADLGEPKLGGFGELGIMESLGGLSASGKNCLLGKVFCGGIPMG
jgi:hypothetical protein